jgi:methylenetetrahydrofolate dehydrogenase (NADP+)/methenyltetrahydrofolate cyclohydrolase
VQDGVIAVDVGTNAVQDEDSGDVFLTGDLDLPSVSAKAEAITPVPGGVGPITDVWLIGNVLAAAAMSAQVEPRFGELITGRLLGHG